MSTLSSLLDDLISLVIPRRCVACGRLLGEDQHWACTQCLATMSTTDFHLDASNPMVEKAQSLCPMIYGAAAHFYFMRDSSWRNAIHTIKYRSGWLLAQKMGYQFGCELIESPYFGDIDIVIPIPLHPFKRMKRTYNQSEHIARGVAKAMGIKQCSRAVVRCRNNPSQVRQSSSKRWANVDGIFRVANPKALMGRNILLVDDVFTTGATMVSCAETILAAVPSCRVSIATLAISKRHIQSNSSL